jgi:hypothetical protein
MDIALSIQYTEDKYLKEIKKELLADGPLFVMMECGNSIFYSMPEEIPECDTPCPCGNPDHWLVKYSKFEVNKDYEAVSE